MQNDSARKSHQSHSYSGAVDGSVAAAAVAAACSACRRPHSTLCFRQ